MTTTINADSSNGFKVTADTSSILALQTNGTTAISIDASQAVSFTNAPTVTGGTANGVAYLNGSKVLTTGSALVFDGTNLGIGTNLPGSKLEVNGGAAAVINTNGQVYIQNGNTSGGAKISARGATAASDGYLAFEGFTTEYGRFDASGNFLVGTTTLVSPNPGFSFSVGNQSQMAIGHLNATTGTYYAYFNYNGSIIGSITQNGTTGVLYNLTSDYRLKNDQQALTGAKDFVMALKPKKWQWWDGSGEGVGFVAHEFMEVAKHSGHGEKDAVDADGKPKYQSIQPSSSEVMANLVSFIQEQQAIITQLQADVALLKGA